MNPATSNNSVVVRTAGLAIVGLIVIGTIVHFADYFILGRIPVTNLSASQLSTAVAKGIGSTPSGSKPVVGKDFTIQSVHYFVTNTWAVVFVTKNGNNAVLVEHKQNGSYTTVLGPGTTFSANSLPSSLPTSVVFYLNSQGLINNGTTTAE